MKKYLFIVIPIIILISIIFFVWIYTKPQENTNFSTNEVINEELVNNEESNYIVEENIESSKNIVESDEEIEKEENTSVAKEDTSKKEATSSHTTSVITTNKNTSNNEVSKKVDETPKQEQIKTNLVIETQPKEETKIEEPEIVRCTTNNNHSMGVGNSGKWFSTKDEAISYYKNQIKYWDEWWQNADPNDTEADATYYKSCPTGYEIWSCMYCSKWTINFYYR